MLRQKGMRRPGLVALCNKHGIPTSHKVLTSKKMVTIHHTCSDMKRDLEAMEVVTKGMKKKELVALCHYKKIPLSHEEIKVDKG